MDSVLFLIKVLTFLQEAWGRACGKPLRQQFLNSQVLISPDQTSNSKYLRLGNDCQTYQDLSLAGNPFQVGS